MRAELVVDALQMALHRRRPGPGSSITATKGRNFVSLAFGQAARDAGIAVSMGLRGDCFDNAVAESSFATLTKDTSAATARSPRAPICGSRCSTTSRTSTTAKGGTAPSATSHQTSTRRSISLNQERDTNKPPSVQPNRGHSRQSAGGLRKPRQAGATLAEGAGGSQACAGRWTSASPQPERVRATLASTRHAWQSPARKFDTATVGSQEERRCPVGWSVLFWRL